MKIIAAKDSATAWRAAAAHLISNQKEEYNLLIEIAEPCSIDANWLATYNPRSILAAADVVAEVANTIFPAKLAQYSSSRGHLYKRYARAISLGRRIGPNQARNRAAWGTYFGRLTSFGATKRNQLEAAINALSTWPKRQKAAITFHLTSPETDGYRTRGGPCWHFAEINWRSNDVLDLVVVYRNHDYFNKSLGNFIGLGRLLKFIAEQSGKKPGKLTCHSVRAYFDVPLPAMKKLAGL